jgi:hypothetical protein
MPEKPENVYFSNLEDDENVFLEHNAAESENDEPFVNLVAIDVRSTAAVSFFSSLECLEVAAALSAAADWLEGLGK